VNKNEIKIILVAFNIELYYSWKKYFDNVKSIEVIDNNILLQKTDTIVSPANSFGYMDGGLDLKYSEHFGWNLEKRLRNYIVKRRLGRTE